MTPLLLSVWLACANPTSTPTADQPSVTQPGAVDVATLKSAMDNGNITVIDVRTDDEYNSGHVPGARHIPLNDLPGQLSSLQGMRDQEIYLICAVGGRSARAATLLAQEGFTHPINVEGGTNAWRTAGYPLD